MNRPHLRTPEGLERRRIRDRARRKKEREARGANTRQEWLDFVRAQRAKKAALVIQPSVSKQQTARLANVPGQTVEQWIAKGGQIERLPGYTGTTYTAGLPVRSSITGARGL